VGTFAQRRTWARAVRLGLSLLVCLGRHTVTGLLTTCGRLFRDWSADYRLFSQDAWEIHDLFAPILKGIHHDLPWSAPFLVALDDTHLGKTGTHIPGVSYQRDPLSPPFHVNLVRSLRFIQVSGMYAPGGPPGPARCIPLRFEAAPAVPKPKHNAPPEALKAYKERRRKENLNTAALATLAGLRRELDGLPGGAARRLIVAHDGTYTNQVLLRGVPERTTLIGRIRKDAKLFSPPAPAEPGRRGAKRKYGPQTPTPNELRLDDAVPWREVRAYAAGQLHTFRVKTLGSVLWPKAGAEARLRLVVIAPVGYRLRKGSKLLYHQPAYLICTDPNLSLEEVLQYYLWRWDIEVNHRDEKRIIRVGEAQVRSPRSVKWLPAFAVASYAMLLLAGVRAFGLNATETACPPPLWRHGMAKKRLSTEDFLQYLRSELWSEALDGIRPNSGHFAITVTLDPKSPEFHLPMAPAVLYCRNG
jgi:hypothetical protein